MIDDRDYSGPRWRYANQYRPLLAEYWPYSQRCTLILGSQRADPRFPFGTFDVSRPLPENIVSQQQLAKVGRVYTARERLANVRSALAEIKASKRHIRRADAIRSAEAQLTEIETAHAAGTLTEIVDPDDLLF